VSIPDEWREVATELAKLPEEQRKRGLKVIETLATNNAPAEEVGKPPVAALGDYLDRELADAPVLVHPGIAARGAITVMVARGGKGKTAVSLNRIVRWAMGKALFDELPDVLRPDHNLRTLIVENEGAPGHFQKVLRTILTENGFTEEEQQLARENIFIWGDGGWSGLKLDDEANIRLVKRAVEECKPDILFVEPFRGLWRGNENDSTEMANVMDRLSEVATEFECAVLLTHHERKSGAGEDGEAMSAARGSGVLEGHAAVMERWIPVKGGQYRELSWIKARFEEAPAPLTMSFNRSSWSYDYVGEDDMTRDVEKFMVQFPDSWMSAKEISEETGYPYHKVRKLLGNLKDSDPPRVASRAVEGKVHFRWKDFGDGDDTGGLAIT
jgi:hypothetical protein